MEFTKKDYEDRKSRIDAGEGSDEDRRLVKLYESTKPSGGPVADTAEYDARIADQEAAARYDGKTQADLKAEAKERGLATGGTKEDLVARLKQADDQKSNVKSDAKQD